MAWKEISFQLCVRGEVYVFSSRAALKRIAGWPVRVKEPGNQGAGLNQGDKTNPKWLFPPHFHLQTSADGGVKHPLRPSHGIGPSQRPCCSLTPLILVAE